ncbi:MAG: hemerythrin domain-containing protein [Anaerolineae bacterium]|nr:hemerythrin domain-containing protein [Anaerolineae bacterium]MDW8098656.1 hemerythrin domain-containing protein [Anaerolineae bacterium]
MKIIEALLGEHGALYAQLEHLERAVLTAEMLAQIQSQMALLSAALDTHARLEDRLLFTALDPYLGPMGPLTVMRMEHDQIENLFSRISQASSLSEAQGLVLQLIHIARDHFAKEEQVLFPMAVQILSQETLLELGVRWSEQRQVVILATV